MRVQVLRVRVTDKGFNVAHCQCGNLFGEVLASAEVTEPGEYELKSTLREKEGRIVPLIRVEKA